MCCNMPIIIIITLIHCVDVNLHSFSVVPFEQALIETGRERESVVLKYLTAELNTLFGNKLLKGQFTQKWKFRHHLLTLRLYQSCMHFFLLNTKHDIWRMLGKKEYTPHIFVNIWLYIFMWQHCRNNTFLQCKVVSVQLVYNSVNLLSAQNNSTHSQCSLNFFFLLSKTFLYWADISVTWAKISIFIPDLYSTHTHTHKNETFNLNVLFLFDLTLDFN